MMWLLFHRTPAGIIRRHYSHSVVTPGAKKNTFKIIKQNTPTYIAKYFTDKALFDKEVGIIRSLPAWWGLTFVNAFSAGHHHFIITEEIPHVPWSSYNNSNTDDVADFLYSQIDWLFEKRITCRELRLDDVLLDRDRKKAIIIDFEPCVLNSSDPELYYTYKESFKIFPYELASVMHKLLHKYTCIVWTRCPSV